MEEKTDHDRIVEMHTVIWGTDGSDGIARQVSRNSKAINKIWIVVAVIVTSIGGGTWGIFELISRGT